MKPCLLLLALAACSSAPEKPTVMELRAPAWVGNAGAGWDAQGEMLVYRVTGHAPLGDEVRVAQAQASKAASTALRAFCTEAVARLQNAYAQRSAELFTPDALAALSGDKDSVGRIVDAGMVGARNIGEWSDDEAYFVWLELDAGAGLLPAFEADLGQRLAAHSRELTASDLAALRTELATFIAQRLRR
ncbi:MAG TPA: hypothetical protein VFY71_01690 [Planctomycetota bacterium]|nr:hypothetical protein [Planctomycetota bacterium]